jgi:hypothetical protein
MPSLDVPADTWTTITTTTEQTAVQCLSGKNVYVTTEATGGLDAAEGLALGPLFIPVFGSGKTLSVYSKGGNARIMYMGLGTY